MPTHHGHLLSLIKGAHINVKSPYTNELGNWLPLRALIFSHSFRTSGVSASAGQIRGPYVEGQTRVLPTWTELPDFTNEFHQLLPKLLSTIPCLKMQVVVNLRSRNASPPSPYVVLEMHRYYCSSSGASSFPCHQRSNIPW